jgi:cytochrome c biogenesis factor
VNPLVNWIWAGGFVFVIGNALLLWRSPERVRES